MYVSLQIAACLSILSHPFLPFTSKKLKNMLNLNQLNWDDAKKYNLPSGSQINESKLLFNKIEDEQINNQIAKLKS